MVMTPEFKKNFLVLFILLALLMIYYNSVVLRGKTFMTTIQRSYQSGSGQYHDSGHPTREFPTVDPAAANQTNLPSVCLEYHYLKKLRLPLWNPYSGLGRPYSADMTSLTFFLPIYVFKLFPSLRTYDLFLLSRLLISGFFLFLLLRSYKCPYWAAMAGGAFYMFNSHFHAFIDMDHINVTTLLSPMAFFLTKFLFSLDRRYLVGFILCSAGSFFGGNPNEYILVHLYLTVYFIFLSMISRVGARKIFRFLPAYVMALGMSVLLSLVKLIPFIEFWNHSYSCRAVGLTGTTEFLPFKKILTVMFSPDHMFGGPNYIGYLITSLMFYSLFNLIRKKWKLREKILAFHFVFLFLVISKINGAAYINWIGTLPLLRDINYVKYSSLVYYLITLISSFSLTYLLDDIKETRSKILSLFKFFSSCALPQLIFWMISKDFLFLVADKGQELVFVFSFFVLTGSFLILEKKSYENKAVTHLALVILALLAVFELRLNNPQHYRERFKINDRAPYTKFLLEQEPPYRAIGLDRTLSPNHNLIYPISTINRIFAIRLTRPTILLSRLISNKFDSAMPQTYLKEEIMNNALLDLLNTKYYISESIIDSIVIDPDYAHAHKIQGLIDNPSMKYTRRGSYYHSVHQGWQQSADSSVGIPVRLPHGDVYLKSTALAFDFDGNKRENPQNRLQLMISVGQGERKDPVYERVFTAHREGDPDFFNLKVDLSAYSGQDVILHFTLKNPGAEDETDRLFFFGDLRITYSRIRKSSSVNEYGEEATDSTSFEVVPYEEIFSHQATVYRNTRAMERGFVLYDIKPLFGLEEAVEAMKENPLLYKHTALIEGNPPRDTQWGVEGRSKVVFADYRENYVKVEVETSENGVFILSDAYYPGWKAHLNGKQVEIYPAFGALRAVFLPKGVHKLEFRYRPWTFYSGAFLTLTTLIFIGYVYFSKSKWIE